MANRLFLAVRPTATVADDLESYVEPRRGLEPGLRWAHPEHWHVTLAFLGRVCDDAAADLSDDLAGVAARTAPFDITIGGAGGFPQPDNARALWLGVSTGAAELAQLARRCRTAVARRGLPIDGGGFHPHLTLARSRGTDARRWLAVIDSFGSFSWPVTDFVLVDSELTRGGPRHRVTDRFQLTGGGRMQG